MSNKTNPTDTDPKRFLSQIEHPVRREDGLALFDLFERATGMPPVMWGDTIIGYGRYQYRYDSGREGEWMMTGFSPRKQNLAVYIMPGFTDPSIASRLERLGKHRIGRSCLTINKLADVDSEVLESIIAASVSIMRARYTTSER